MLAYRPSKFIALAAAIVAIFAVGFHPSTGHAAPAVDVVTGHLHSESGVTP